jgi:hypothetical protein
MGRQPALAGAFWLSSALLLSPEPGWACSCTREQPPREALADATAVFRGVITGVEPAEPPWRSSLRAGWCTAKDWLGGADASSCVFDAYIARHWENYGFVATFQVKAIWKGITQHQVRVRSDVPGGGSCGLGWAVGDEWVVYAQGSKLLSTNGCMRHAYGAKDAADESQALGVPAVSFK